MKISMEKESQVVEIDFLGLNSTKYEEKQQINYRGYNPFIDSDKEKVETCLSLGSSPSSSCSLDPPRELLPNPHPNKKRTFNNNKTCYFIPDTKTEHTTLVLESSPVYIQNSTVAGFTYMLNDPSFNLRCFDRRKTNKGSDILVGRCNEVAGHIPTVAMARKATLSRFLEKRLHRIKQARPPLVIGRSSQNDTDSETTTSSFKYQQ